MFLNKRKLSPVAINICTLKAQKKGEVSLRPILSTLAAMLQIRATQSISLGPFSEKSPLMGPKKPGFELPKIYEPRKIRNTPRNPPGSGVSPTMSGEVMSKKTGVKLKRGRVRERSEA